MRSIDRPNRPGNASQPTSRPTAPATDPVLKKEAWFLRAFTDGILDASVIKLSDRCRFVLMVLDGRAGTDPFCFPGNKWVREKTGKKDSALEEIYNELEDEGWLVRAFTEAQRKERIGFIFLRRIDPATSPSAENTPQGIERARGAMLARIAGLVTGNPATAEPMTPEIRGHRPRKSVVNDLGNPGTHDPGNPGAYKDSVVVVRDTEKDPLIQTAEAGISIPPNDNDQAPTPDPKPTPTEPAPRFRTAQAKPTVVHQAPLRHHPVEPQGDHDEKRRRQLAALDALMRRKAVAQTEPAEIRDLVELSPENQPGEPTPAPIADAADRVMVDARQAASMADEPINAGPGDKDEGIRRFFEAIGPERHRRFLGMSPGRQWGMLQPHAGGFTPGLVELQVGEIDRVKVLPAALAPPASLAEAVERLAGGEGALVGDVAEGLCRSFGSEKDRQLWPAFRSLAEQVYRREVSAGAVLDSFRQAMGPKAGNPGAVFTHALKHHGWRP